MTLYCYYVKLFELVYFMLPLEIRIQEEDECFSLETECLIALNRWEEALTCYKMRCNVA